MANVKGSTITGRLKYVRTRHGEEGVARLLAAVQPATRAVLNEQVLAASWVPFAVFIDLCVTIDKLFGRGDLALCVDVGRYTAEVNLPVLYKIFYRVSSPQYILTKGASLWRMNYDAGQLTVESGDHSTRLILEHFPTPHRAHCLSVLGWATRSVEMSGGKRVAWDESGCRASGDPRCVATIRWE
jgi:hypothetical protein